MKCKIFLVLIISLLFVSIASAETVVIANVSVPTTQDTTLAGALMSVSESLINSGEILVGAFISTISYVIGFTIEFLNIIITIINSFSTCVSICSSFADITSNIIEPAIFTVILLVMGLDAINYIINTVFLTFSPSLVVPVLNLFGVVLASLNIPIGTAKLILYGILIIFVIIVWIPYLFKILNNIVNILTQIVYLLMYPTSISVSIINQIVNVFSSCTNIIQHTFLFGNECINILNQIIVTVNNSISNNRCLKILNPIASCMKRLSEDVLETAMGNINFYILS